MIFHGCMIHAAVMVERITSTSDVDVLGHQRGDIVGGRDDVRREVGSDLGNDPGETDEEAPQRPAGPSHWAAMRTGSQMYSPYTTFAEEQQMMPNKPRTSWMPGGRRPASIRPCRS